MIELNNDTHIVGIWYASRINLGKVYLWALRGKEPDKWIGHIRYRYDNLNITLNIDDDNPYNTFLGDNISEDQMIKICKDRFNELKILFIHDSDYFLIGGNFYKLEKLGHNKGWIPLIRIHNIIKKIN